MARSQTRDRQRPCLHVEEKLSASATARVAEDAGRAAHPLLHPLLQVRDAAVVVGARWGGRGRRVLTDEPDVAERQGNRERDSQTTKRVTDVSVATIHPTP